MTHEPEHPAAVHPPTGGRLEDGAVALHASRVRGRPPGRGAAAPAARRRPPARRAGGAAPRPTRRLGPLLAGGSLLGLAAGLWGLARGGERTPPPASLPAPAARWGWRGHQIAWYGQGQGEPVVLVHAAYAAASAREMRQPFGRLARDHRVMAYDLLGFGASDRPPLAYDGALYVELMGDFLAEVVGEPCHVVASSLSAGHALHAACRWPEHFRSLVLVNPAGMVGLTDGKGPARRLAEAAVRAPLLGEALFRALVSRPSLAWYDRRTYRDRRLVDRPLLDHQYAVAHQPNARFAAAAFLGGSLAVSVARDLKHLVVPALAVWTPPSGFRDTIAGSRSFAHLNPHLENRTMPACGALPHEECAAEFEVLVRDWWGGLAASPTPSPG